MNWSINYDVEESRKERREGNKNRNAHEKENKYGDN